jgi:catechol 2,3-dioxygenase-like lactoylglutathione lyase family enzyme
MKLAAVTYVVRDYDEAISWFTNVLGFVLQEDLGLGDGKRWVRVSTPGGETSLLLAKADGANQLAAVGHAAGGRVGFFLHVKNFEVTHSQLLARGVQFRELPRYESYGTVAVFDDLYGNGWDLIGPPSAKPVR